jgi:hypothetical protein
MCGAKFTCMHNDEITKCQCATVHLEQKHRDYIQRHFTNCLCRCCLIQITTYSDDILSK